ncbi:MAG: YabP/YqfC family sporulation protein [Firmicutes bacterium]|nr:YabP/YqfC family sporulation protein [Bacillota bacterium]
MAKIGERLFSSPLAEDLVGGQSRIELTGGRRLLIEDHRGILEYTDSLLRVALRRGQVRVTGDDLRLTALTLRELAVSGTIRAIELEGEG